MPITCPKCRFDNPNDTAYCGKCATPLPIAKEPLASQTETIQTPVKELTTGSTFAGRYQVIEELGHGGMGRVYKVFDTKIKEKVALKLIKPEIASDKETIERFSNELRLARKIGQRNVCRMFDMGEADGAHFITMEYVHGEDLKSMIHMSGSLSVGMLLSVGRQVCDGLAEAHSLGVVHRDLKPQNIMIDKNGNAKIMDFGIARSVREKGITGPSVMVGTPEYMSPEQAEAKEVDHRSDIYSLGIILYEMATSHVPFTGETALGIAMKHKGEIPKNPKQLNPHIPDDLSAVILKCLEKDKERRYQSASEVHSELEKIEKGIPTAERVIPERKIITSRQITVKFTPRKIAIPLLGFTILAALAVVVFRFIPKKPSGGPLPSGKPALAILYFENISGDKSLDSWKTGLTELLITKLHQSKFINVLDGNTIYTILKKLGLDEAKKYTKDDLLRIANEGKATYTLSGSLMKAGTNMTMALSLQKPHTGEVVSTPSIECKGEDEIFLKVDELAKTIRLDLKLTADQIASDIDEKAGKITTESAEAFKYYAEARKRHVDGKNEEANELYQKAISIDPEFAMAYRGMSATYGNLGFLKKEKEAAQKAMEFIDRVSERERYTIQGNYYSIEPKTYNKAIETFEALLQQYPDDSLANINLGWIYGQLEEGDKAAKYLKISAKLDKTVQNYMNLGYRYEMLGRFQEARDVYEDYLKNVFDNPDIHRSLAGNYLKEGKFTLASAEADKAFLLDPKSNENLPLKGEILYLQDNLAGAENEFLKLLEGKPDNYRATAWGSLASIYLRRGKVGKAIEQYRQLIGLSQTVGEKAWEGGARAAISIVCWRQGRINDAEAEIERLAKIADEENSTLDKINSILLRGVLFIEKNSLSEASQAAEELKKQLDSMLFKRLYRYYFLLQGLIELKKNNPSAAVNNLEQAVNLDPSPHAKDPLLLDFLALAYLRNGDMDRGRTTYENIVSQLNSKWSGDIYVKSFYMLGRIAEQTGDMAKAREHYRKFLDLWKDADPGIPEVEDARKRLAGLKGS